MIKTYERTMFIENLADANVKLYVYENSKYSGNIGEEKKVNYTGLKSWSIVDVDMAQKMPYIENIEIGTLVAFRLSNGRVKSAKVTRKSTKNRKLKLETDYGAEYIVSFDDIVWVRTGKRWPRGVYKLLKGLVDENGKEEQKS